MDGVEGGADDRDPSLVRPGCGEVALHVRPRQFGVLRLQALDLCSLVRGHARTLAGLDVGLAAQVRTVSAAPMPSFAATAFIAAHSVG
jgi:hypothetical protein